MLGGCEMTENPLLLVEKFGQSIWLDYIRRHLINSGDLRQLIEADGLKGVTSNPAIFEKAIAHSNDYDEAIRILVMENKNTAEIFEALTVADVQQAADVFFCVYDRLKGKDGFVALRSILIWPGIPMVLSQKPGVFGSWWEGLISLLKCRQPKRVCRLSASLSARV